MSTQDDDDDNDGDGGVDTKLNRILKMYDDKVMNETKFILSADFTLNKLIIYCGLSPARDFCPSVKLIHSNEEISFDYKEWTSLMNLIQNVEHLNESGAEVNSIVWGENKLTVISKYNKVLYFSEQDVEDVLKMNFTISHRLNMLVSLHFNDYYTHFMKCIKKYISSENTGFDLIYSFCNLMPCLESYCVLECIYHAKDKILSDLDRLLVE
ncbi:hypothetical protein WA026_001827 [Henosepilachna vigintioctopunctata]|uniref:Uncharacterized protein n=1 Tax=Henosepilachna vigintioctopunctata TaxID=420089 RepID=A0AAW1US48_9CUCU